MNKAGATMGTCPGDEGAPCSNQRVVDYPQGIVRPQGQTVWLASDGTWW